MSLSDPIADMLTRIRNGVGINTQSVNIKSSKVCVAIAQVLKDEGYIEDYTVIDDGKQGILRVTLKYGSLGEPLIQSLVRKSKPGCRVYQKAREIPRVLDGLGIAIVSTSKGVMSDSKARENNVGGELLCTVY